MKSLLWDLKSLFWESDFPVIHWLSVVSFWKSTSVDFQSRHCCFSVRLLRQNTIPHAPKAFPSADIKHSNVLALSRTRRNPRHARCAARGSGLLAPLRGALRPSLTAAAHATHLEVSA